MTTAQSPSFRLASATPVAINDHVLFVVLELEAHGLALRADALHGGWNHRYLNVTGRWAARGTDMLKRQDTSVAKAKKAYFDSLVRVFGQALLAVHAQPPSLRAPFLARLDAVCGLGKNVGYGVGDEMGELLDGHAVRS